ncbi:hypothetical protein KIS1582_2784 [Cytobacillus firmus]|uniref:Uncharacterized protein n=1 Tax=Cytobacillus firmus TaxID=1399 RepID=A0A380X793_CYTFI|nr:hypothetical protein KIS1582_2784 [Cytobacillus firmus]SUU99122.1 Uncharacterised protein [Cytobacillus firmus]
MRKALSRRLLPIKIKSILNEGMAFPSKGTGRAKRFACGAGQESDSKERSRWKC